ncbi:hypothetical protein MJ1HA_1285 [Metallosphaera sedula]|nr:hypothetical protein MJ1HA_1285 [Metallosphaera sedula]
MQKSLKQLVFTLDFSWLLNITNSRDFQRFVTHQPIVVRIDSFS